MEDEEIPEAVDESQFIMSSDTMQEIIIIILINWNYQHSARLN